MDGKGAIVNPPKGPNWPTCICHNLRVNGEVVGRNINEECPEHGIGTEYYREREEHWNRRLRELRARRAQPTFEERER